MESVGRYDRLPNSCGHSTDKSLRCTDGVQFLNKSSDYHIFTNGSNCRLVLSQMHYNSKTNETHSEVIIPYGCKDY